MATAWGGLSHGVAAMLAAEAWQWAAAEYANELGAETGDADHFKTGATLAAQAKQQAAAAWELSSREAAARPKDAVDLDAVNRQAAAETAARREQETRAHRRGPEPEADDDESPRTRVAPMT